LIPKDQIEKLQNSVDIVDVIGERIDLKRSGSNYKARCPFHDEKTPSFMVSQAKQIYKCFGCGASGDSIKFVMSYENLSYPDAIRHLASRHGIEIVEEYSDRTYDKSEDDKKELFRILNKYACDFFHENLIKEINTDTSEVAQYLKKRKLSRDLVEKFKLGFAPDQWNLLKEEKRFSGQSEEILIEAGLRKKNEKGNVYDQFRSRLMFPIFDAMGNVAAFSGRSLSDEVQPKYLNSPETPVYKKNEVLYGLFQAMDTVRKTKEIILVEGNIDIITMHKFGFTNTVAICGTSFTENHARLIKRNADKITILLDGDEAGKKSALKTAEILAETGMVPGIVLLPGDSDPDSFLYSQGKVSMEELLSAPLNLVDLVIQLGGGRKSNANEKAHLVKNLIGSLKHIKDPVVLDLYTKEASQKSGVDINVIKREIINKPDRNAGKLKPEEKHERYFPENDDQMEFGIIYLMLSDENARSRFLSEITENDLKNKEASRMFLKIYELHEDGEPVKLNNILIDFSEKFKDFMIGFVIEQDQAFLEEKNEKNKNELEEKIEKAYRDNIKKIKLRRIAQKMEDLRSELKYTEDHEDQNEILKKISLIKAEQGELVHGQE
jgi:DNA primase